MIIITQFKNEELRLKDWIEHHYWLGFNQFLLFNDNSTDNSVKIIKSLQANNINILLYSCNNISGYIERQLDSVNRGLQISASYEKEIPILITDVDEYLVSGKGKNYNKNIIDIVSKNFLSTHYDNYYILSYDIQPSYSLNTPHIMLQETNRWSENDRKTKQNGYWKERGKSLTTNKRCPIIKNIHGLHDFNTNTGVGHVYNKSLLANEWDMRLHHFRLPPSGYNDTCGSDHYFREFNENDDTLYNITLDRINEKHIN
jgi:hypothetical protein